MKTAALTLAAVLAVLIVGLIRYDGTLDPCDMMRQDLVRRYGVNGVTIYYDPLRPLMDRKRCLDGWWELNFGSPPPP